MPKHNVAKDFLNSPESVDAAKKIWSHLEDLKNDPKQYKDFMAKTLAEGLAVPSGGMTTPDPFISPVAERFKVGDRVVLYGLKTTKYNGQIGTIAGEFVEKKGRWPVMLTDGKKAFKPTNLRLATREDEEPVDKGTVLKPVMCIKTRIAEESIFKPKRAPSTKVFVNYLQIDDDLHPLIKASNGKRATIDTLVSNMQIPIHLTAMWDEKDKKGNPALRVDCVMNSMVFEKKKTWPQMNHWIVDLSFKQIEEQEEIKLSRDFIVLKKEKYYGVRKYAFKPSPTVVPDTQGGILPDEPRKPTQKQASPEILLPFKKMGDDELKPIRTSKLVKGKKKKKKSSVRLVVEETDELPHVNKAKDRREFLDLTKMDDQVPTKKEKQRTSKFPIQEIPNKKPLIEELSSSTVNPSTEDKAFSPNLTEVRKTPLVEELVSSRKGDRKDVKNGVSRVKKNRPSQSHNREKSKTFKVRGKVKETSCKTAPPYRIVRGSKGVKVIVILDDARCALEVNCTWETSTRELQVETTSNFLSVDLASELKSKTWDSKDPVTTFSTKSKALKVAFLRN